MTSAYMFKDAITSVLAKIGLNVELWRGTPRRSSNLLEINTRPVSIVLYVKYSNSNPGFWGLTANQLDRLNNSRSKWYVVLLARSMSDGYLFNSADVNRMVSDGIFELGKDGDHKVNETTDCGSGHRFSGVKMLVDHITT